MFSKVIDLLQTVDRAGTVLFYPSSCFYHEKFQSLPFDNVILNSNSFSHSKKIGKVICTKVDNNALLGLFKRLNITVTDLVIIRDGCIEGGNYECCASNTFLGKIIGVQQSPFNAFYCHCFSDEFNLPAKIESVEVPEYLHLLRSFSNPMNQQQGFKISPKKFEKREFQLGHIKVGLIRESITNKLSDYEVVLFPRSLPLLESFHNFMKGQGQAYQNLFYPIENNPDHSFAGFLETAKNKEWQKVAVLPFGKRRYKDVLLAIQEHKGSQLQVIDFFHLHNSDYRQIYKMSCRRVL